MPAPLLLPVALTSGVAVLLAALVLGPPPRQLPDRMAVIPEDAVTIDNDFYSDHDWWHVNQPLQLVNAARIPWFVHQWKSRLPRSTDEKEPLRLLDVGSGGGVATEALAGAFPTAKVVGVDPAEGAIDAARRHAGKSNLPIEYVVGSAYKLPFATASFDGVVCSDVLEHLNDVPLALSEIARVLKPGGVFVFDTINRTFFSWIVVIRIAQDLLHVVPHAAHDWRLFITPTELQQALKKAGLLADVELTGMRPTIQLGPFLNEIFGRLSMRNKGEQRGLIASLLGPWSLTAHSGASYLGYAQKALATPS